MAISGSHVQRPAFDPLHDVGPLACHTISTLPAFFERHIDTQAAVGTERAGYPGQVELPYLALLKKPGQAFLDVDSQRHQQHAAGAFVQTMYLIGARAQKLRQLIPEVRFAAPVGEQRNVRRFVDHRKAGFSMNNGWHLECPVAVVVSLHAGKVP